MDKKIGIIGAGQLGRMLALACHPLGIEVALVDQKANSSAHDVADVGVFKFEEKERIAEFFSNVDVVTYEFENIPVDLIEHLSKTKPVFPPTEALRISRHRAEEKNFVSKLNIPVPKFRTVSGFKELSEIISEVSFPVIIKTCSQGYDGKGQFRFKNSEELKVFLETKPKEIGELILEEFIKFDFEVSCIAVRSASGECKFYALCENDHDQGILSHTIAPSSRVTKNLEQVAQGYTKKILEALNYVGVLAVEYFVKGEQLYFNEYAPRVHNSGHWTIEGATTSQFENHIRACLGLPLGSTESEGYCLMLNLLGTKGPVEKFLKTANAFYHWYGKKNVTGRRKVGHVNLVYKDVADRDKVELSVFQERPESQNV